MVVDAEIIEALASLNIPIFKWFDDYDGTFPAISYRLISSTPVNFGDDKETDVNYIYQVSLITENDDTDDLVKSIRSVMLAAGFTFISCDELRDEKDFFITAIRFYKTEREE